MLNTCEWKRRGGDKNIYKINGLHKWGFSLQEKKINRNNLVDAQNAGKYLYKIRWKWENKISKMKLLVRGMTARNKAFCIETAQKEIYIILNIRRGSKPKLRTELQPRKRKDKNLYIWAVDRKK
jgi:hypothetical protein